LNLKFKIIDLVCVAETKNELFLFTNGVFMVFAWEYWGHDIGDLLTVVLG
jgi:hypothetical protein